MKVLYVDHTSLVSGAQRSLLELLAGLPDEVEPTVACPAGLLSRFVREQRVPLARIPETTGSFKLHPWHTSKAAAQMTAMGLAVRRVARRRGADLVHANSTRAGLVAALAERLGGPPWVVHVRDCMPPGRASDVVRQLIERRAAAIIAVSGYVAERFSSNGSERMHVVRNQVDLSRFDPATVSRADAREALGIREDEAVLAMLGQISPWKGHEEAIEAFARIHPSFPSARLLIAGEPKFVSSATGFDNLTYYRGLLRLAETLGVTDDVEFLGERRDVPRILRAADVLVVPSWEEPLGRTVVEGMSMGTPVIATSIGGPAELIRDGVDGLLVEPKQPERWAVAIERLLSSPEDRARIGRAAHDQMTARFSFPTYVRSIVDIYRQVIRDRARPR